MRLDELHPLEALLVGDFRSIEPRLVALDKHLTLRTYLDGYTLGDVDTKIWLALRGNRAALSFLRKGTLTNLTRWFVFIEHTHPEIQADVLAKDAEAKAKIVAGSKAGGNYNLALQDAEKGVVTRFLPEPSGYLHIGHVKAALLSDYFAHVAYKGTLRLRLDDTNPSKEKEEYQDAIIEDLALMGVKTDGLTYTSDYFDYLYEMCKRLISEGLAYADDTDKETMQKERREKIKSKRRDLTVEENLKIFDEMKEGTKVGLENCIRAKISYDDVNGAMRDPVIYRCNIEDAHHRLGRKWKV
jgi:glutamyl-tRNA synthetase